MAEGDGVSWDEEVLKERAKIHAQRNPIPPLPRWKKVVLVVLGALGLLVSCQAWKVMIG